ncbi:(Na+)-NQR maturation NqrM [Candidatus Nitrospira salsa]
MMIFTIVFVLMVLTVLAMAVGVLTGRNSLEGSCGGLKTIQGIDCMVCPTPCETQQQQEGPCPHTNSHLASVSSRGVSDHIIPFPKKTILS